MKNFTIILMCICTFVIPFHAQSFSGGDGTIANPYKISTKAELLDVTNYADKAFVLLNDIDFNGDAPYTVSIIGSFSGKFDGMGYRITNITFEGSISFFQTITETGRVKNLHLKNFAFTDYFYSNGSTNTKNQYHAPFVNTNSGAIENCSYEGPVTAYFSLAGFVLTNNGTIINCFSNAIVNAYDGMNISNNWFPGKNAGGFVLSNNATGTIINCYSAGTVTVGDRGAAGFAWANAGIISNSFAFNTSISSTWYGDAVHRFANSSSGVLSGVYAYENMTLNGSTTTSVDAGSIEAANISSGAISNQATYTDLGWDFVRNWKFEDGYTYPQLRVVPDCPTITLTEIASDGCELSILDENISGSGGEGTYEYALYAGTLPTGLSLSTTGNLSGTLSTSGSYNFTVSATDENGCFGTREYSFTVFPTKTSLITESICMGSDYSFGLQTLTQSGIYSETFSTVNGCDSIVTLTLTVNPSYGSQLPLNENIIAYYPFNGDANDESGNGHHGTVEGATLIPDRFGKPNGAYSFDGINDYIDAGDWENGGAMTFNFWAKWEAWHNWSRLLDFGLGQQNNNIYIGNEGTKDNLMFHTLDGSTKYLFYCDNTLPLDTWVMITCTMDETGIMKAYQNGELIGTFNGFTPTKMIRTAQYFGKSNWSVDGYFKGAIDEVTIYNTALTEEEVQNFYSVSEYYISPVNIEICSSELPYIFNSKEFTASGTYTETLQTNLGCDSIITLNLQVNPDYDVMYSGDDAVPDYLINETFEEIPLNTFPADWNIRYSGTGVNDHFVVTDPVKNGSRALKVSGSGWAANLSKPVANISGNVVLEGWMRAENVSSGGNCGLAIGNPGAGRWGAYLSRIEFYNGNLITYYHTGNSGGDGPNYVLQPALANTWYHVKIETNAATGTYKVYINDQQASSLTGGTITTDFPLLPGIPATSTELYGNSLIYFDDIRMYESGNSQVVICESETPYIFGDQELTESGTYTETFQSINGCDSLVTLKLKVNPVYSHTDEVTICEGETYIFGEQNLTTPGEYTEVFESGTGCDSTVILTLHVNPVFNHADQAFICQGDTYIFGTQNLTATGEYTEVFESVSGCDSTVVLTLTVNPVYDITTTSTVYSNELPITFGTQVLTEGGTYTESFISVNGCDSVVELTLVINPADIAPPVILANPIQVNLNKYGQYNLVKADIQKLTEGTTDNETAYEDLTIEVVPRFFSCEMAGIEIPVIIKATDLKGNISTASSSVKVIDPTPPEITCKDIELFLDENGYAELNVTEAYSSVHDACGVLSVTAEKTTYKKSDLGIQDILVIATDNNNNIKTCKASITVTDTIPPKFSPVGKLIFTPEEGSCGMIIEYPSIHVTDNSRVKVLKLIEGKGPGAFFALGNSNERWIAVDDSGNSDTLNFEIMVENNPAAPGMNKMPDIEMPEDIKDFSLMLSNVKDGSICDNYSLDFNLKFGNPDLIQSFRFNYTPGNDSAQLTLNPEKDAFGETSAIITVTNNETQKHYSDTFNIHVTPVNDPPIVLNTWGDQEINANEKWEFYISPYAGVHFDDMEDELLQLSLNSAESESLPEWISFQNDSLIAVPTSENAGCITLKLTATDSAGEKKYTQFNLCVTIPVGISSFFSDELKIYPNPTTGKLFIDFSRQVNRITDISIINILGMEVYRQRVTNEKLLTIDLSHHPGGMYILKASGGEFSITHKILLKTTY